MATVEERLPEGRFASVRPALFVFAVSLVGSVGWISWYLASGQSPSIAIATGLSVGGLILAGNRTWPMIGLAVFLSLSVLVPSYPLLARFASSLALALGALTTAAMIRHRGIRPAELLSPQSLLWVFLAALLGSTIAALLIETGSYLSYGEFDFVPKFAQQALGMILAAPLVLAWAIAPREQWTATRWFSFVCTICGCGVVASLVFLSRGTGPIAWAVFPPLVFSALVWHLRGATTAVAVTALPILFSAQFRTGPFALADRDNAMLLAQTFVAITSATTVLLATYADGRRTADKLRLVAKRLEVSQRNLTNMARDASTAIAILDRDLRYIAASQRYLSLHRLPRDQPLEGRSHFDVFEDCSPEQRVLFGRVLDGEQLSGDGDILRHADGSVDYVRWSHRPWYDEDDRIAGIVLSSEVVTAEREARRKLEEAERRYRAVFEQAGVGVGRLTLDGVFLEVNDRICALTGYTADELVGTSCETLSKPDQWQHMQEGVAALIAGESRFYSEDKALVMRNGASRPVHCTANLVRNGDGAGDYLAIVIQDITPRVEAQSALEEKEKLLRLAQEAAGVGVWEIDLIAGGSRQSPETARMFGLEWRDDEYRMADVAAQLGEEQVRDLRRAIGAARENEGPLEMTLRVVMPEETRWVTLQGRYDPHDGHPRLLGLAIDITRAMEAEAQLREVHERLLRLARLNAMGAMASTLAHELNQPLAAITNYLEACRYITRSRGDPDHSILDALDRARVQALRAGDIIRKIRSFTVSGEIAKSELDLAAVIRSAASAVRQLKIAKGVRIECAFDFRPHQVVGDPLQIEQVVSNLIRNAVEATSGSEQREVMVCTHIEPEEVLVQIVDTGPGLSGEMLENPFEPFRSTKETGTGLGLPICRTIVEAHGGRLWAENDPKGGAVFNFTLPLLTEAEEAALRTAK